MEGKYESPIVYGVMNILLNKQTVLIRHIQIIQSYDVQFKHETRMELYNNATLESLINKTKKKNFLFFFFFPIPAL